MLYILSSKKVNNGKLLQPIRFNVLQGRVSICSRRRRSSTSDKGQKYAGRTGTTKTGDDPQRGPLFYCAEAIPLPPIELRLERNATGFSIHTYGYESHIYTDRSGRSQSSFPRFGKPRLQDVAVRVVILTHPRILWYPRSAKSGAEDDM
jgi:hypothetical protein